MNETTRPPRKEDLVKLCEELNRYLLQIDDEGEPGASDGSV